jgi:hypothetical protein
MVSEVGRMKFFLGLIPLFHCSSTSVVCIGKKTDPEEEIAHLRKSIQPLFLPWLSTQPKLVKTKVSPLFRRVIDPWP